MNNSLIKPILLSIALFGCMSSATLHATPRDAAGNNGAVLKLQAMVKSLTSERDAAKAESAKLTEELKQFEQLKQDHAAVVAAKEQLDGELAAQKNNNGEVRDRLDKTHAKLLEVIEKYKMLNQAQVELRNELAALKTTQQTTEEQLGICDERNVKLYQSAKELLDRYQSKGTLASLLQDEPVLQFQSVEMENIVQDYEDKLNSGKYRK